jgi:hypothetical protein
LVLTEWTAAIWDGLTNHPHDRRAGVITELRSQFQGTIGVLLGFVAGLAAWAAAVGSYR